MQEESAMDKKSNSRSAVPNANKATSIDTKVKQDGFSSRFPRTSRRWEGPQCRPDPSPNKPVHQKAKVFDKRSRTGGGYHNENWDQVAKAPCAEVGSALRQGSKKQNLNHLLNFTYTPVENSHAPYHGWGGGSRSNRGKWNAPRKHKYNKEEFLQANCQFVVQAAGEYTVHSADPDRLVEWNFIEQVRLMSHEIPSCPVCLYPPVAAKITRCGHVFCWSCMLHYLALSDKSWRKCPICFESVHKHDLKSVLAQSATEHAVGETITMCLIKKERGSVISLPRTQWRPTNGRPVSVDERDIDIRFVKLLLASPMQVLNMIIQQEKRELEAAYEAEKGCPESCFIETALLLLQEREERILEKNAVEMELSGMMAKLDTDEGDETSMACSLAAQTDNVQRKYYASAFSDEEEEEPAVSPDLAPEDELSCKDSNGFLPANDEIENYAHLDSPTITKTFDIDAQDGNFSKQLTRDTFYFYQASNGQHIYMTSLNIRMLVHEYGSLDNAPETFSARIVEKESLTMHEDWRKRLRYLEHLPLTCEFEIVELDFKPPLISVQTLVTFAEEMDKRKQKRQRRARDERRHNRRAKEQENKTWGKYPSARIHLDNYNQFPQCGPTADVSNNWPTPTDMDEHGRQISPASSVGSLNPPSPDSIGSSVRSFAQMLREGKARPDPFPALQANSCSVVPSAQNDTIVEDDESLAVPSYNHSFSDALQTAIDKADTAKGEEHVDGNRQKKKKGKKTLLFTTNMARGK